ncbi:hypothetical protein VNI00_001831 [Paramarasmius palmivorus]|uniref:Uncharacterized protein n=1 Tax=Paramarasmius palmivorus TaxID=297713 RepID=A0AAW0E7J9_9AGAR
MRQSGQSIFSRPRPIDINAARRAGYGLDIDIESDEEDDAELGRPLIRQPVVFDAEEDESRRERSHQPFTDMPLGREERNVWA